MPTLGPMTVYASRVGLGGVEGEGGVWAGVADNRGVPIKVDCLLQTGMLRSE